MPIIFQKAGLEKENTMNYNPWVSFPVPQVLFDEVFPWVDEAQKPFELGSTAGIEFAIKHQTARAFLAMMMDNLQHVIIQDAAAMIIFFPDCANHGLFQLLLFCSQAFFEFTTEMKAYLDKAKAPYNAALEDILSGVHQQFDAMNSNIGVVAHQNTKLFS